MHCTCKWKTIELFGKYRKRMVYEVGFSDMNDEMILAIMEKMKNIGIDGIDVKEKESYWKQQYKKKEKKNTTNLSIGMWLVVGWWKTHSKLVGRVKMSKLMNRVWPR